MKKISDPHLDKIRSALIDHKQIQSSDAVSFSQAIYQLGFSHKEYSGVEEQSQRSVVKKVASVQLAWSGTFWMIW